MICRLYVDYNIPDPILGTNVFKSLLQSSDLPFLIESLEKITDNPVFDSLSTLWDEAHSKSIVQCFEKDDMTTLMKYMDMIVRIPSQGLVQTLESIFKEKFQDQSLIEKWPAVICVLMCLNKLELVNARLEELDGTQLLILIDSLNKSSALNVQNMKSEIIKCIFKVINSKRHFKALIGNKHMPLFLQYIIESDDIESLLLALIQQSRMDDAKKLITIYLQSYCPFELSESGLEVCFDSWIADRLVSDESIQAFSEYLRV